MKMKRARVTMTDAEMNRRCNTYRIPYRIRAARERAARARQVKMYYRCIGAALFLAASIFFAVPAACAHLSASTGTPVHAYKYYRSVVVKSADDVQKLADEYADPAYYRNTAEYIDEVNSINHLKAYSKTSDRTVMPGDRLVVPYYSAEFR